MSTETTVVGNWGEEAEECEIQRTETPRSGFTATGYGRDLPTDIKVRYACKWRRVYVTCFSNCASYHIMVMGKRITVRL